MLPNRDKNAEECDAIGFNSSNAVWLKRNKTAIKVLIYKNFKS